MRQLYVYKNDVLAGILTEVSTDMYKFKYDATYLLTSLPAISVAFPKKEGEYIEKSLFPLFQNMLPEGANRRAVCRLNKIDENDMFGLLMSFANKDVIGDITFKI
ncbi:MAG: HipA N-terminal domain-containing protein [Paludibacteraceae bacterium]|nr:HipA N-terminal domain-containing protein [Paludibacteraceae bacterium]